MKARRLKKKIDVKMLLAAIAIRRQSAQQEKSESIRDCRWSKVPGWDGIDIGLMMAEKIINDEASGK